MGLALLVVYAVTRNIYAGTSAPVIMWLQWHTIVTRANFIIAISPREISMFWYVFCSFAIRHIVTLFFSFQLCHICPIWILMIYTRQQDWTIRAALATTMAQIGHQVDLSIHCNQLNLRDSLCLHRAEVMAHRGLCTLMGGLWSLIWKQPPSEVSLALRCADYNSY